MTIINQTKDRIPRDFIKSWTDQVFTELKKRNLAKLCNITVVFVSESKIKKLNSQYRNKNKATDVLSFESDDPESLGELVLCLPVLKKQAREHKLTLKEEIGYMILHGILHLLGYDHETSERDAKKMFRLQDSIFEKLLQ